MGQTLLKRKITERGVIILTVLITIGVTLQAIFASIGRPYTHYNNFLIFKNSFGHLIQNKNLYLAYPQEYFDLYKYTPTFSLFMGVFYYLHDYAGLILLNLLNVFVYVLAIRKLNFSSDTNKYIFLFLLLEYAISLHWGQTNTIITSLVILAFCSFEKENVLLSSLFIALTVFIKIYGIVGCALFILYPKKIRFLIYLLAWFVVLTILPVLIVPYDQLIQQYKNWIQLLQMDYSASYGVSFLGWVHSWFNVEFQKSLLVCVAVIIFCLPLLKVKFYKLYFFRLQILASILLWMAIFNHKGESPTYIIAMEGVALWYFSQKPDKANQVLFWLCLVFTSFTSTDIITPMWINEKYVTPYSIKAIFCSIIWFKLIIDLLTEKSLKRVAEDL